MSEKKHKNFKSDKDDSEKEAKKEKKENESLEENPSEEDSLEEDSLEEDSVEEDSSEEDSSEEKQYSFLRERIKKDKRASGFSRKGLLCVIVYGFIFGAVACLSFFMLKPWVEGSLLYAEEPGERIIIVPDDSEEANGLGDTLEPEVNDVLENEPERNDELEDNDSDEFDQNIEFIHLPPVLTGDSYQEMMNSLRQVAMTANRSIAYIEGVNETAGFLDGERTRQNRVTGLIVEARGGELMIIAPNLLVGNYSEFRAVFSDNSSHRATFVVQDSIRGLAAFSVEMETLTTGNLASIEFAVIGNSNSVRQGDIVIGVGNILGHGDGLAYGMISSNQSSSTIVDSQFRILSADFIVSSEGTAVLFNRRGQVIGLLKPGPWQGEASITANVVGITELLLPIQTLVNGERVPFFGVEGITVTEEIALIAELPEGIYVRHVEADSPAMRAGIQNGDIIITFNEHEVLNVNNLSRVVLGSEIGETVEVRAIRRGADEIVEIDFTVVIR